jgi:hypothetical protein
MLQQSLHPARLVRAILFPKVSAYKASFVKNENINDFQFLVKLIFV